jgi:hypothetical protein
MAYKNSPIAADSKQKSQPEIQENFLQIAAFTTQDHETFGSADIGKHKQTTFIELGIDVTSAPPTLANEAAIYCRQSTYGGNVAALFFRPEGQGAGAGIEYDFTSSAQAADGWTRLPSGILLKWGTGTANGAAAVQAFPVAGTIPVFAAIYQVMLSTAAGGGGGQDDYMAYLTGKTVANMTVNGSVRTQNNPANGTYAYLAIGI